MGSSSQSGHVLVGFCYNPGLLEKATVLEVKSHQVMVYSVRSGCEFELVSVYKGGKKKTHSKAILLPIYLRAYAASGTSNVFY